MKNTIINALLCSALLCAPLAVQAQETLDTRIGKLKFTHDFATGYPTDK